MIKSILVLAFLITVPAFVSESFSFLNGDMIDQNFENYIHVPSDHESQIIKFNESPNEQQLKRYLIFGKGYESACVHESESLTVPLRFHRYTVARDPGTIVCYRLPFARKAVKQG